MKRGFTMIELIFVIVILGILASVAIPKLGASREDAKASAAIATLATLKSAVPAYYVSQKEASIGKSASIDPSLWVQTAGKEEYTFKDGSDSIIIAKIVNSDNANTVSSTAAIDSNATTTTTYPFLMITKGATTTNSVFKQIWDNNMTSETNISIRGLSIQR